MIPGIGVGGRVAAGVGVVVGAAGGVLVGKGIIFKIAVTSFWGEGPGRKTHNRAIKTPTKMKAKTTPPKITQSEKILFM